MKRFTLVLMLVSMGCAMTAFGQTGEVSLSLGRSSFGNNSLGDLAASATSLSTAKANSNFHLSLKMTVNSWRYFGHEFGYNYNRGNIEVAGEDFGGMPVHQGFYDFLAYALPEGKKIRPFAAGGVHFSSFYPPGASVFSGNGITKFGVNFGGGVKVRVSDMFMVRFDLHDYETAKPDLGLSNEHGWLRQIVASAGLAFVF